MPQEKKILKPKELTAEEKWQVELESHKGKVGQKVFIDKQVIPDVPGNAFKLMQGMQQQLAIIEKQMKIKLKAKWFVGDPIKRIFVGFVAVKEEKIEP